MERDEHIFAYVMDELENGVKNEALWVKAYAMVDGIEEKITPRYIQYRVEELKEKLKDNYIDFKSIAKDDIYHSLYSGNSLDWMQEIWEWADSHDIPDYTNNDDHMSPYGGGLARKKDDLLKQKHINLSYYVGSGMCGWIDLDFIPKELCRLPMLNHLRIGYPYQDMIPECLYGKSDLVIDCSIEVGEKVIKGKDRTKQYKLEFQENSIDESSLSWLMNLWKWADSNNISTSSDGGIPREYKHLISCSKLDMSWNSLIDIPEEISYLSNITQLDLSNNRIREIPRKIGEMTNLTQLDLDGNSVSSLPDTIGNLNNLKEMDMTNNCLSQLPKEIGKMINLITLSLIGNSLLELPNTIGNLSKLQNLQVYGNSEMTELPREIIYLKNLTFFSFGRNIVLTQEQQNWIDTLKKNGCSVNLYS